MQIKDQLIFRIAAFLGFLTVLLGSLGAHAIKFKTEKFKELFDIALLYQSIHVPVLLFLALLGLRKVGVGMSAGVIAFCWPLFLKGATGISLGPIVPTGGMILLFAWILLFFSLNPEKKD